MQENEPAILLSVYVCMYTCVCIHMCINSGYRLIFPKLHNTCIPCERGVLGSLVEFHKILNEIVKGRLQNKEGRTAKV
jgi:hypothetical protein